MIIFNKIEKLGKKKGVSIDQIMLVYIFLFLQPMTPTQLRKFFEKYSKDNIKINFKLKDPNKIYQILNPMLKVGLLKKDKKLGSKKNEMIYSINNKLLGNSLFPKIKSIPFYNELQYNYLQKEIEKNLKNLKKEFKTKVTESIVIEDCISEIRKYWNYDIPTYKEKNPEQTNINSPLTLTKKDFAIDFIVSFFSVGVSHLYSNKLYELSDIIRERKEKLGSKEKLLINTYFLILSNLHIRFLGAINKIIFSQFPRLSNHFLLYPKDPYDLKYKTKITTKII